VRARVLWAACSLQQLRVGKDVKQVVACSTAKVWRHSAVEVIILALFALCSATAVYDALLLGK